MDGYTYPFWQEGDKGKLMVMDDENFKKAYQKVQ
jgi:hypothetical protein